MNCIFEKATLTSTPWVVYLPLMKFLHSFVRALLRAVKFPKKGLGGRSTVLGHLGTNCLWYALQLGAALVRLCSKAYRKWYQAHLMLICFCSQAWHLQRSYGSKPPF